MAFHARMGRKRSGQKHLQRSMFPSSGSDANVTSKDLIQSCVSHCNHLESIGKLNRDHIQLFQQAQCSICAAIGLRVPARWICLNEECLMTGNLTTLCGSRSGEKYHASAHSEAYPNHCILWNLRNSRLCCMKCAAEIYKDANVPALDVEIRRALMPLKRNHKELSSTESTELLCKKGLPYNCQGTQAHEFPIGSFEVINRPLTKNMEDGFDLDFPKGLTGLYNMGNTCYFNASIQVLSNCPPFSEYFRDKEDLRPFANREPLVANTVAYLFQKLWSAKREPAVFPKALLARIRDNFPQFRGWSQQDAQELIRCLLELLHSELCQPVYAYEDYSALAPKALIRLNSTSSSGSDQFETADSGWSSDGDTTCTSTDSRTTAKALYVPVRWRSIVTDVFDGSIESCVTCLTCKTVSVTTETFQDLSLPIPSAEHLSHIRKSCTGCIDEGEGTGSELNEGYGWIPWLSWLRSLSGIIVTPSVLPF
ncbi:ubiquitinyl hydrolase 1 [Dictyocaulus viviparus]|uniref:ubiquitinyl hydrolase 1 n=1 Tax=Dictyocaulus viviparus TaxID=29172 RepID=A0A0D8XQY4_DICVI|nr:ubiquitinyl hydrolase 1 [Dictyocaulus viviparus]